MKLKIDSPCSASVIVTYGIKSWPIWECEPSKFTWNYIEKESCLILEGEALIKTNDGEEYRIKSGDFVCFPSGMECTWEIYKTIKKHYRLGD